MSSGTSLPYNNPGPPITAAEAAVRFEWDCELRQAARRLLSGRRRVWATATAAVTAATLWMLVVAWTWPSGEWIGVGGILLALSSTFFGVEFGRNSATASWLLSLRKVGPSSLRLTPGLPLYRWAQAYLDGQCHLPGAAERAERLEGEA